jgi:hypothetical protein
VCKRLFPGMFAKDEVKTMLHNMLCEYGFACVAMSMSKPCAQQMCAWKMCAWWSVLGNNGFMLLRVADHFGGFFLFLLIFWLCATLMLWLVFDIMLLQRPGVISFFLILIYSLYKKKVLAPRRYVPCCADHWPNSMRSGWTWFIHRSHGTVMQKGIIPA